jgi:hypothetical protein
MVRGILAPLPVFRRPAWHEGNVKIRGGVRRTIVHRQLDVSRSVGFRNVGFGSRGDLGRCLSDVGFIPLSRRKFQSMAAPEAYASKRLPRCLKLRRRLVQLEHVRRWRGEIVSPVLHELAALGEQVAASVGRFGLVLQLVRQGGLDHLS